MAVRLWIDFPDRETMMDFVDVLNLGMTKKEEQVAVFETDALDSKAVRMHETFIMKRITDRDEYFRLKRGGR